MSIFLPLCHVRQLSIVTAVATEATSNVAASASATAPATASPSPITISRAKKSKLRSEFDPDKALEIYALASSNYNSPSSSPYPQDLTASRFADIETVLESHKSDPLIKDETYLSTLIRSYGRAGMFDHALRTYQQMDQLGTPRSVLSLNAPLSTCIACKLFDKVPDFFREMAGRHNIVPDRLTYGFLLKSFCYAGLPDKGTEIMREMQSKGVKVTAVDFTTIVCSLYKKEQSNDAEKLWKEMVETMCVLEAAVFNVRLMHAQDLEPDEVKKMFKEMSSAGVKPSTISYNYLMTSYCKLGMVDEAKKVYDSLKEHDCKPNGKSFRILVDYLCRNGEYIKGYKVFLESVKVNKIPDFGTLKILVEELVKMGRVREARRVIRTVNKKFPPNMLKSWNEVEENLGLALLVDGAAASSTPPPPQKKKDSKEEDTR